MSAAKQRRQRLIADWLRERPVASQEELVQRLADAGIEATQATVSRDLDDIGAAKRRHGYELDEGTASGADARLSRVLAEWVRSIEPAGSLLVLKTPPGSAGLVARALDQARLSWLAGTVAGDDTVFVALANGTSAGSAAHQLREAREQG